MLKVGLILVVLIIFYYFLFLRFFVVSEKMFIYDNKRLLNNYVVKGNQKRVFITHLTDNNRTRKDVITIMSKTYGTPLMCLNVLMWFEEKGFEETTNYYMIFLLLCVNN